MTTTNTPGKQFTKGRGRFLTTKPRIGRLKESPSIQQTIDQYKHIYAIPFHGDDTRLREHINDLYSYLIRGLTHKRIFHTEPLNDNTFRTSLDKTKRFWLYWYKGVDVDGTPLIQVFKLQYKK